MKKINTLTVAVMLAGAILIGFAGQAEARKRQAPVSIAAVSSTDTSVVLELTFNGAGEAVKITSYGTGDLSELAHKVTSRASVAAGEKMRLTVQFDKPDGAASVAVAVEGQFAGRSLNKVSGFAVGKDPVNPNKRSTGPDGEPIIIMPAQVVD